MYCLLQHLQAIKLMVFLVLQVKVPLISHMRLVAWEVNSVGTSAKYLQVSYLLLHFSILFFVAFGNKD